MKRFSFRITLIALSFILGLSSVSAQQVVHDVQKEKQWRSMETGPWDFAPDWYYYFLHKNYSGAETYWQWAGFKSGLRVRFKEENSNVKRVLPVRVAAEEAQRQKLSQVEKERIFVNALYKEDVEREANRNVDLSYPMYKDEFARMERAVSEGLIYCHMKSNGKLKPQIDEINRVYTLLCADIDYIHKTGIGYGLENAKRQKAYEEIKTKMSKIVSRTANLCAIAATHY